MRLETEDWMMVTRSDPEKHKKQVRAANRARYRAVQLLIADHQDEFDLHYAAQAAVEGVEPKPRGRLDAVRIENEIAVLKGRLARLQADAETSA